MKQTKKTIINLTIGLTIGVVFVLIWLHIVDIRQVLLSMRNLNLLFVVTGVICYLTAYFFRSMRWRMLLGTIVSIGSLNAFLTVMGGHFTNYLIPLRAGEIMKCLFIKKMTGVRMSQSMPSVFLDKLYDTTGIVLVLLLLPLLNINVSQYLRYLIIVIVIFILLALLFLFFILSNKDRVAVVCGKLLHALPNRWEDRLNEIMNYFIDGITLFKQHKGMILPALMLSVLIIFFDSLFFLSMFWAFGERIGYFYVLFGYTLIYLSFIIPHPPAQIGSNELLMVLIFSVGFGMGRDMVSAVMVFAHLLTGVLIVLSGIVSYSYAGVNLYNIINIEKDNDND